jgi:hypothetical protein
MAHKATLGVSTASAGVETRIFQWKNVVPASTMAAIPKIRTADMAQGNTTGSAPRAPLPGDIVVSRSHAPGLYYTIAQLPGRPQLVAPSRNHAVQLARKFAIQHHVDVWHVHANAADLIASFRPHATASNSRRGNQS